MSRVVLITGGCGFIGSNFINLFYSNNPDDIIVNLDAMYYCASKENVNHEVRNSNRYHLIEGNTQNEELVNHVLNKHNITHVINFAAQSHVTNSFSNPLQYTRDNILGTHTLLECCRKYGKLIKFIHVSTDEVYGESHLDDEDKKHENSILCPTNPYAATKASAELIVKSYYYSFKMPILITRGNNVYGSNQYPEKVIPVFIQLLKNNKKLTIEGTGTNTRGFLHVFDVARAFELVLNKGSIGEIYNIGCEDHDEISIINLAKLMIEMIKKTTDYDQWITYIEDRKFNDQRYYISSDKIKGLGWSSHIPFEEGLRKLINN
jgi:dTDP-glucose 4,6-dehydratase